MMAKYATNPFQNFWKTYAETDDSMGIFCLFIVVLYQKREKKIGWDKEMRTFALFPGRKLQGRLVKYENISHSLETHLWH